MLAQVYLENMGGYFYEILMRCLLVINVKSVLKGKVPGAHPHTETFKNISM